MGNEFVIKNDVKLSMDDTYVYIDYEKCFAKKITSRAFPTLIGKDDYKSEGVATLGLLNLLEKDEEIDQFYMFRGDVAEHFVGQAVAEAFGNKHGKDNVEVIIFADKQFTYGDMWHYDKETKKGNKDFGGRPDIAIKIMLPNGDKIVYLIEVKSKTHTVYEDVEIVNETTGDKHTNTIEKKSDWKKIAVERIYPETEVLQGVFLANMSNLSAVTMFWVFFNDKQENELRELLPIYLKEKKIPTLSFGYQDVTYHNYKKEFSRDEVWRDMLVASNNLKRMAKEKRIPQYLFTKYDLKKIQEHIAEYERIESIKGDYNNDGDVEIPNTNDEDTPF
jgi:hypothetical protein